MVFGSTYHLLVLACELTNPAHGFLTHSDESLCSDSRSERHSPNIQSSRQSRREEEMKDKQKRKKERTWAEAARMVKNKSNF